MRNIIHTIKEKGQLPFLLLFFTLFSLNNVWADGSKDLYPSGKTGVRAYLRSNTGITSNWPFANRGTHYVYAKVGEQIGLASSAQGSNSARIYLYAPDGTAVVNGTTAGNIPNRAAELAGPRLPGVSNGNGYTPVYYTVPEEGVYRVEFVARSTGNNNYATVQANANWTQSNNDGIMAWDVSVVANGTFIKGRTYTNILNLNNGSQSPQNNGFEGLIYVLTKDGYTYRVNNNGNNGMYFTFFVNNNGFIDAQGKPIYKSLNTTSNLDSRVHNPNNQDGNGQITHKLFYTLPSADLPETATISYPNQSNATTWLKGEVVMPEVEDVKLIGAEGVEGQISNKGGYITFEASSQGQYTLVITPTIPGAFTPVTMTGPSEEGLNRIHWDGKDGAGVPMPSGNAPATITVQLQGAEVHFPFFDMEYNTKGIIIELLDHEKLALSTPVIDAVSDIVYWNDVDVSNGSSGNNAPKGRYSDPKNNSHLPAPVGIGSQGTSSNSNGHIWGIGASGVSGQFGDNKSIDTWTFIKGELVTKNTTVSVRVVDLYTEIAYKVAGVANASSGSAGQSVEYTVTAGNMAGYSDVIADSSKGIKGAPFTFTVPIGVDITNPNDITFTTSCTNGTVSESIGMTYNPSTRVFSSELNLPSGCSITYTFTGTINGSLGLKTAESTIMRQADVTDIDATNGGAELAPSNPHYECYNDSEDIGGPVSGAISCNNIKEVSFMLLQDCADEYLYYEDFGRGYFAQNDGRTDWTSKTSIGLDLTTGLPSFDTDNVIVRNGAAGGATSSYLFAPGLNDNRYAAANTGHSNTISVARIKNGYYAVLPPGYVQMGIPETDSWNIGLWVPNAPTNDPDVADSNYDWTPAWTLSTTVRDVSGAVNGSAFLVRGATSASQSIKPFYEFNVPGTIAVNTKYTLSLYSYVTYHDKDYMLMDVIDQTSGHIYATVPLKYPGPGLPPNASPEGFSLGWIPLEASFVFDASNCSDIVGKNVRIAIRGSQDRALDTGKGFGHTLLDDIAFTKRTVGATCEIPASEVACESDCYEDIEGKGFEWNHPNGTTGGTVTESFEQPGTNGGYILDIYYLDNSFNMLINGAQLYDEELEFQRTGNNLVQNVRFKSDGAKWEDVGIDDIWKINRNIPTDTEDRRNNPSPALRVMIDIHGNATLYGKRANNASLEELEVFDKDTEEVRYLNNVHWYTESTVENPNPNKIIVSQNIVGVTSMKGFGYGLQIKPCETCIIEKEGAFNDLNADGFAQVGETITYTFDVVNLGDMDIYDVEIVDPLFGYTITIDEDTNLPVQSDVELSGDTNSDGILNWNERWTFTVDYKVTSTDIFTNKGVYNRAEVKGMGKLNNSDTPSVTIQDVLSTDPTPYKEGDEGWDENRPFHTFVPLEGSGLLITNPMIYQRMK